MPAEVLELVRRAAGLPRVVLATDFDGTLAPFVQDPMTARPAVGAAEALRAAAGLPGVTTALVSGRDLAVLTALSGLGDAVGLVFIGSHGAQTSLGDPDEPAAGQPAGEPATGHPAGEPAAGQTAAAQATGATAAQATGEPTAAQAALLAQLDRGLSTVAEAYPGAWVERKPLAVALHTRGMPEPENSAALDAAGVVAAAHEGSHPLRGKNVHEIGVVAASKGAALLELARRVGADATVYLGDDVTDERAFEALDPARGDVTIKVGPGETSACCRVDDVTAAIAVLQEFVAARRTAS